MISILFVLNIDRLFSLLKIILNNMPKPRIRRQERPKKNGIFGELLFMKFPKKR